MQLAYEKAILHTPEPVTDASLPTSVNLLGQNLDISMLSNMLQPIAERVTNTLASAGDMLGQTPGLQVPADRFSTWLLNTYVDESVRIVRGDGGAVQVFVRQ